MKCKCKRKASQTTSYNGDVRGWGLHIAGTLSKKWWK
jgi:hypothetical protein